MAIKSSGSLSMTEINSEFGHGRNLGAYNGKTWYKFDGTIGSFSLPIRYSDFFNKQKNAAYTFLDIKTSTDITVPKSQTIAMLIVAGGGAGWNGGMEALEGGGGGGAGGVLYTDFTVPVTAGGIIRCTIGAGAVFNSDVISATQTNTSCIGTDTTVSHIVNGATQWTYTAKGGGAGGSYTSRGNQGKTAKSGGSGGGGNPYYGQTNYALALALNPMQGSNGGRGIENVTGGGGGGWKTEGYNTGGDWWGENAPGANGGDGGVINQFGWSGAVGGGGGSSGGAPGGQRVGWGFGGLGGGGTNYKIYGPNYSFGDPRLLGDWQTNSIYNVAGGDGAANTGGGGGGSWGARKISSLSYTRAGYPTKGQAGAGGSGRVIIWYNP